MKHLKTFEAYVKSQKESNVEGTPSDEQGKKVATIKADDDKNIVVECDGNKKLINTQEIEESNDDEVEKKVSEAIEELGATHVMDEESEDDDKEVPVNEFFKSLRKRLFQKSNNQRVLHHLVGKK